LLVFFAFFHALGHKVLGTKDFKTSTMAALSRATSPPPEDDDAGEDEDDDDDDDDGAGDFFFAFFFSAPPRSARTRDDASRRMQVSCRGEQVDVRNRLAGCTSTELPKRRTLASPLLCDGMPALLACTSARNHPKHTNKVTKRVGAMGGTECRRGILNLRSAAY